MFYDPTYFIFIAPALLLGLWAQTRLRGTFARYARVPTSSGVNGQTAAQILMQQEQLKIGVRGTPGVLTDFYNPANKTINLSQTSGQNSIASVAVVAHELGHAVQDQQGYTPMRLRAAIVPGVQIGAWVGPLMFIAGYWLRSPELIWVGIFLFALTAIFAVVTLPVEFNASRRGLAMLQTSGILSAQEIPAAKQVLDAAALTYVAAAAQAVLTLLYYLSLVSGRRR
ncbi:MAG TPA: zinc metallopeptidase [Candidatus Eremiobacteraceae bacterium]|nr:zinc metallopeptidase [Candidatus Eremiobacteraceae bacterium]